MPIPLYRALAAVLLAVLLAGESSRAMLASARLSCLWFTPATKSTNFGSRYLGEWSSEEDEIIQVAS